MDERSKKVLRRKLIAIGLMLAVLFGSILVAGAVKRGDHVAVASAEEVDVSDWEVVSTEYAFTGTAQDDDFIQSMFEVGYFSAKVENGKIVVTFTFYSDYDYTKFKNTTYFHNLEFKFTNAESDTVTVTKKANYDFFMDPSMATGMEFPKADDTYSFSYSVADFTSLTATSTKGKSITSIVDFKPTGIDISGSDTTMVFSTVSCSGNSIITETKHYALPTAPEKEGYVFTGWYTDEACTNKYTGTTVTADTTLYAGYTKQELTVSLVSEGETEDNVTVNYGEIVTLPDKTRDGYDFLGWYYENGEKYNNEAITENVTLTAKFRKKPVLTLSVDGETETTVIEYGSVQTLPDKTKTGYNFLGWFYDSGEQYNNEAITEDVTLTAKFEVKMLKVRFIVDGEEYKSVDVPYGSSFSEAVAKANLRQSSVKSVVLLNSVAGEGEETPADDQTIPEALTSDVEAEIALSALDSAKDQTENWLKTTWNKIADFFKDLWAKIADFFVGLWYNVTGFFSRAWEAVAEHFRVNWKWYAIGGGSAVGLGIVIAVICKVRR